jgi:hypothetical protein
VTRLANPRQLHITRRCYQRQLHIAHHSEVGPFNVDSESLNHLKVVQSTAGTHEFAIGCEWNCCIRACRKRAANEGTKLCILIITRLVGNTVQPIPVGYLIIKSNIRTMQDKERSRPWLHDQRNHRYGLRPCPVPLGESRKVDRASCYFLVERVNGMTATRSRNCEAMTIVPHTIAEVGERDVCLLREGPASQGTRASHYRTSAPLN